MDFKEEYQSLVKTIKDLSLKTGKRLRNADIAKRLGYNPDYFASLTGKSGKVTIDHVSDIKSAFRDELAGIVKPSEPGDPLNRERAMLKVLWNRFAKREAERLGVPVDKVLDDMDADTMIEWRDLEGLR